MQIKSNYAFPVITLSKFKDKGNSYMLVPFIDLAKVSLILQLYIAAFKIFFSALPV